MSTLQWPHAGHYNRALQDKTTGALLANTQYNVYLSDGTTLATIYTDNVRTSTRSQPLQTDSAGNAEFFTDPYMGLKIALVSGGTPQTTDVMPDVSDLIGPAYLSDNGSNTSYALSSADNLKRLGFGLGALSTASMNITVPNDLPKDFQCSIYNEGQGAIRFVAASGATLEAGGVTGTSNIGHPGYRYWCDIYVRKNATGTQAVVTLSPGIS